ncbi:Extradiol_Dioxygenase_3B_like domain-containing protein [Histoplasma capsulatum]|uniref:Extradiol_Dioxygenase_3B_like domain-containing protein n=1 Tax=Ajellomyces capsulatus TaxID=5037 RepID=A0A8A1MCE1_AJECA|nr:Extradiol_Dioxygenase_3B_like domain-containing protein [Histoplasma capsulatum]
MPGPGTQTTSQPSRASWRNGLLRSQTSCLASADSPLRELESSLHLTLVTHTLDRVLHGLIRRWTSPKRNASSSSAPLTTTTSPPSPSRN